MDIYRIGEHYATNAGLALLEEHPDFIETIWKNNDCRTLWEVRKVHQMPDKILSKITLDQTTLLEKRQREGREFRRYLKADMLLKDYDRINMLMPYFGNDDEILLPFIQYKKIDDYNRKSSLNREALMQYLSFTKKNPTSDLEYFATPQGDAVAIDPHCPMYNIEYENFVKPLPNT